MDEGAAVEPTVEPAVEPTVGPAVEPAVEPTVEPTVEPAVEPAAGSFTARVRSAVADRGPLCVGIDPHEPLLAAWGLPADAAGVRSFGLTCVEALAGTVAVVKPQVAFFERWGPAGSAALEDVIAAARAADLLVIADAKRGDIGSTMEAYAGAWLDPAGPGADAVTLVPYLGLGALRPALTRASAAGLGVIVVVRSSNPEGRYLQTARVDDGQGPALEDRLLVEIAALNRGEVVSGGTVGSEVGPLAPGTVGAVIGATLEPTAFDLGTLGGVVLAPGLGAQGATAADVATRFARVRPGEVLASASRSVLEAGPGVAALRGAARAEQGRLVEALAVGPTPV